MKNEELCFRDYMEVFCRIQHSYARRFLNPDWRELMIEDARKSGCSKKFINHMESFVYNYKGSSDEMYKALDNMDDNQSLTISINKLENLFNKLAFESLEPIARDYIREIDFVIYSIKEVMDAKEKMEVYNKKYGE